MNRRGAVERRISMLAPRCFYKIEQIILGVNTLVKEKAVLEMKNIHKSFPGVRALQGVNFTLCEGEVHALMGENGAGKSTLIKVLTGVYGKDEGEIFLKGRIKRWRSIRRRMRKGLESAPYIRKLLFARTFRWQRICLSDVPAACAKTGKR